MSKATTGESKMATKEDYFAALDNSNKAFEIYNEIRNQYHAREIGDEEFLAAKAEYEAVLASVDEIEAAVDWTEEEPVVEEPTAKQLEISFS